jgi:two-component system, NarL family, invasion response regulator UvrY
MPSVLIADDHAMMRTGLRHYLEPDRSIDTIGETATGAETLQRLREGHWDLVILDINLPDRRWPDLGRFGLRPRTATPCTLT